jgi:tRNA-splicing ligase RtcB
VGFDISCGVRTLLTGLDTAQVRRAQRALADTLYERIPAGLGSTGALRLSPADTKAMLRAEHAGRSSWATAAARISIASRSVE